MERHLRPGKHNFWPKHYPLTGITSLSDREVIQDDYVTSLIEKLNSTCADVSLCLSVCLPPSPLRQTYSPLCSRPECAHQKPEANEGGRTKIPRTGCCDCGNQDRSLERLPATVDTCLKTEALSYRRAGMLQFTNRISKGDSPYYLTGRRKNTLSRGRNYLL